MQRHGRLSLLYRRLTSDPSSDVQGSPLVTTLHRSKFRVHSNRKDPHVIAVEPLGADYTLLPGEPRRSLQSAKRSPRRLNLWRETSPHRCTATTHPPARSRRTASPFHVATTARGRIEHQPSPRLKSRRLGRKSQHWQVKMRRPTPGVPHARSSGFSPPDTSTIASHVRPRRSQPHRPETDGRRPRVGR